MKTTWRETLAWCAGFFDGEGHVGFTKKGRRLDLYLSMSQTDRAVLDRFHEAVTVGKVTGPFVRSYRNPNEHDVYYFQTSRFENIQAIIAMIWAWLGPVKRKQATAALTAVRARYTHNKECRHGHPWTAENTYWSNGYRHCKTCRLAQWSKHRRMRLASCLLEAI